jgi:putative peptidoglycan lipid II flippase
LADLTRREGAGDRGPASGAGWQAAHGRGEVPDRGEAPSLSSRLRAIVRTALPRGAVILSTVTLISFGMGVLEIKVLSHVYGAGTDTDAFNAAFRLPQTALDILVAGGLFACFVPLYVELKDEDRSDAIAFGRTIFSLAVLAMAVAVLVMVIFAPQCISFVAPGFSGDERELAIDLFRILAITQIFMAGTLVLGEVLIAERRWLVYAVAPIFYSGGIMVGSLLLNDSIGIYGAAVGAVGGSIVYFLVRLYGSLRAGFAPLPRWNLQTRGLRRYLWLMLPKMVSQPLESSVILLYFAALASTLQPGSLTNLTYAQKFQTMPELVIGAQFAIAAFPSLSAAVERGDRRGFRRVFGTNLATISVLSTVAALGLMALGWVAVRIVLAGGAFTESDLATTTTLVAIFAVSIPLESMVELVARGMYATRNTLIPTLASVAGFIAVVITSQALAPQAGLLAIPASYGVGMAVKLAIISYALAPRMAAIGRLSFAPWSPAVLQTAGAPMARRRGEPSRRSLSRVVPAAVILVVVATGGLFTAVYALRGASWGYQPEVTPWARVRPSAAPKTPLVVVPPTPVASGTSSAPSASSSVSAASPSTDAPPSATASASTPQSAGTFNAKGQFVLDLYQPGDFIGEITNTWCVPAAMQTMMNIMDEGADTTKATQAKLDQLAVSIAENRSGGPLPEGWSGGLQQLGYGNYKVATASRMSSAVNLVVKQIRATGRPAGLVVWEGWHSWVVSGFVASADPAVTDNFSVIGLYIEDVWYNRHSTIRNVARGGYSRPPDSLVSYPDLGVDFDPWYQAVIYPDKQHKWVVIVPEL